MLYRKCRDKGVLLPNMIFTNTQLKRKKNNKLNCHGWIPNSTSVSLDLPHSSSYCLIPYTLCTSSIVVTDSYGESSSSVSSLSDSELESDAIEKDENLKDAMEKLSKAREKKIQMSLEKKKMKKEKGIPVLLIVFWLEICKSVITRETDQLLFGVNTKTIFWNSHFFQTRGIKR